MFNPAKTLTTGTLALTIGGVLLIAQPFDRQGTVRGAETDAEPAPPVAFTATWGAGGQIRFGRTESADGVTHYEGSAWRPRVVSEATDPRLRGTLSIAANSDDYSAVGGPAAIYSYAFRIENADGAWQQLPTTSIDFGDDDVVSTTTGVLVGEGGYDGLIAVFEHRSDNEGWHIRGYIFDGELPPSPEPVVTE